MSSGNEELITAFVTEATECFADLENDFLAIEEAGADFDQELVNKVFRGIHSMKGTAGFIGLTNIGALAHEMESVLNSVRSHELVPTTAVIDALLRAADTLRGMVNNIETSNEVDVAPDIEGLQAAVRGDVPTAGDPELEGDVDVELPSGELAFMMIPRRDLVVRQRQGARIYILDVDLMDDVETEGRTPVSFLGQVYEHGELIDSYVSTAGVATLGDELPSHLRFRLLIGSTQHQDELAQSLSLPEDRIYLIADDTETAWGAIDVPAAAAPPVAKSAPPPQQPAVPVEAPATPPAAAPAPIAAAPTPPPSEKPAPPATSAPPAKRSERAESTGGPAASVAADASLRVNVRLLDRLMNLAGELVLARNQLLQVVSNRELRTVDSVAARVDQVTSELQDVIMQTRMQPIGAVFNKFPRIVRDLCSKLGKQANLIVEGGDVELDKAIIESIGDPLTHLIRNALDHGLEMPDERKGASKDPTGRVSLRAFHEAGKVNIVIEDDGHGIDGDRLRSKAVEKGVLSADQAKALSARDAVNLIFHPGFSTAAKVTDVSGRGVGMDVVRTNIERLGGTVDVETEIGKGTSINVKLPLTLAIIPSLVVRSKGARFAIPQLNIQELVRIKQGDSDRRIEQLRGAPVLRLRGNLLPLLRLAEILGQQQDADANNAPDAEDDQHHEARNVLVVESGDLRFGLIVDDMDDSEEIVVKPLGRHVKDCTCLAGATILGDGCVALILDVAGIAAEGRLDAVEEELDAEKKRIAAEDQKRDVQSALLFTNHPDEHFAIPAPLISRIERIHTTQIDSVGGVQVLQYRGVSLPLLALEDHIRAEPRGEMTRLYVVVFEFAGREVGLIAPCLQDIREVSAEIDGLTFQEPGVFGSLVLEGNTVRLIDVHTMVEQSHPDWFAEHQAEVEDRETAYSVLIAEDSTFFRNQLLSFLEADGYEVIGCEDGQEAWETLQDPDQKFDLVVTDIEMPRMDGLSLAKKIKTDPMFAHLPVIAVTSLAAEEDIQRGYESGVTDYQVKLDREKLLASVAARLEEAAAAAGDSRKSKRRRGGKPAAV